MKAITIRQPWASLIPMGFKKFETRGWLTNYRGPIAIHAGMQTDPNVFEGLLRRKETIEQLIKIGITPDNVEKLPHGAIIATADLVNVWKVVFHPGTDVDKARYIHIGAESLTTDKHAPDFGAYIVPTAQEMAFGDWTPGRYVWELQNVKMLPEPIPIKGKQGLWDWEPGEEATT